MVRAKSDRQVRPPSRVWFPTGFLGIAVLSVVLVALPTVVVLLLGQMGKPLSSSTPVTVIIPSTTVPVTTTTTAAVRIAAAAPSATAAPTTVPAKHWVRCPCTTPITAPRASMEVSSTCYTLHGRMSDGNYVHEGAVAMLPGAEPLGAVMHVVETGAEYTVEDHIGSGSQFDVWMSSYSACVQYGRRTIHVYRVR